MTISREEIAAQTRCGAVLNNAQAASILDTEAEAARYLMNATDGSAAEKLGKHAAIAAMAFASWIEHEALMSDAADRVLEAIKSGGMRIVIAVSALDKAREATGNPYNSDATVEDKL